MSWIKVEDEQELARAILAGEVFNAVTAWDGGTSFTKVHGFDPKNWPPGIIVCTKAGHFYWQWWPKGAYHDRPQRVLGRPPVDLKRARERAEEAHQ